MTLIAEHIEPDTRERILVVAERLFRQIGYQKTTVADIAKELHMSPANVYRFFDSKKAIHEGVAQIKSPSTCPPPKRRSAEAVHAELFCALASLRSGSVKWGLWQFCNMVGRSNPIP